MTAREPWFDAEEAERLLDGIHASEQERRRLQEIAIGAQKAVDDAASEASRWQQNLPRPLRDDGP